MARRALARLPFVGAESPLPQVLVGLAPLFHEPLFVLVQRGDRLAYSEALRQADTTTRALGLLALGASSVALSRGCGLF